MPYDPADDNTVEQIRVIGAVIDSVLGHVEAMEPRETYRIATVLAEYLDDKATATAQLRAAAVRRLRTDEGLSISAVAEALGMSKARAAQLISAAVEQATAAEKDQT